MCQHYGIPGLATKRFEQSSRDLVRPVQNLSTVLQTVVTVTTPCTAAFSIRAELLLDRRMARTLRIEPEGA